MLAVRKSQNLVLSQTFARSLALTMYTVPGAPLIVGAMVRLLKEPIPALTPNTPAAAINPLQADYTGVFESVYSATVPPIANIGPDIDGYVKPPSFWVTQAVDPAPQVANIVKGYYIWKDDATWLAAENFAESQWVFMTDPGDILFLLVSIGIQQRMHFPA